MGAARSRRRGHGPARLDGQAPRATVAGSVMKERERRRPGQRATKTREAPDPRRAASAPACCRHAWMEVFKAPSAKSAPCTGRSGTACSADFRGAKSARRGGRKPTPWRASTARSLSPAPRTKQKRGRRPLGSHQPALRHRQDVVARDDQVIQHPYVYQRQCSLERLRQHLVCARRLG